MDVRQSQAISIAPIFRLLDPEYLYTSDPAHVATHPGIIGAGRMLSNRSETDIGAWSTELPDCRNQGRRFDEQSDNEKKLFQVDGTTPSFGDATEICTLTASMSRYIAMSIKDGMFLYAVNHAAVDYLSGVRGDYEVNIVNSLLLTGVGAAAKRLAPVSRFRELIMLEIARLERHR